LIKVLADLNALTIDQTRVQLSGHLPPLMTGMRVLLYSFWDFEVEAVIEKVYLKDDIEIWYGIVDWETYRDLPQNP
jgi:hypothetical protein